MFLLQQTLGTLRFVLPSTDDETRIWLSPREMTTASTLAEDKAWVNVRHEDVFSAPGWSGNDVPSRIQRRYILTGPLLQLYKHVLKCLELERTPQRLSLRRNTHGFNRRIGKHTTKIRDWKTLQKQRRVRQQLRLYF
jgi:hypothetical protein